MLPMPHPAARQRLTNLPFLRLGQSPQMVNKDKRANSQDRKDEARLFGGTFPGYVMRLNVMRIGILVLTGGF
jgi:hypothetical protein